MPQIAVLVPGVDPVASGLPPVNDVAQSLDAGSNLVLLDADTGERVLAWAELDAHGDDPARQLLLILPARSLREGHRHVVALRGLVDAAGAPLEPAESFRALRDGVPTTNSAIEARRPAMEQVFAELEAAGVQRGDLFLAFAKVSLSAFGGRRESTSAVARAFAIRKLRPNEAGRVRKKIARSFSALYLIQRILIL